MTKDTGFVACDAKINVPDGFTEWEEERKEIYKLKGAILQARKIIKRQEASKNMMEKTYVAAKGYLEKQDEYLAEVKTDLDNLKRKCANELSELGINSEKAKKMLVAKLNEPSRTLKAGDPLPPKPRKRNKSSKEVANPPRASKRAKRGGGGTSAAAKAKGGDDAGGDGAGDVGDLLTATADVLSQDSADGEGRGPGGGGEAAEEKPKKPKRGTKEVKATAAASKPSRARVVRKTT